MPGSVEVSEFHSHEMPLANARNALRRSIESAVQNRHFGVRRGARQALALGGV